MEVAYEEPSSPRRWVKIKPQEARISLKMPQPMIILKKGQVAKPKGRRKIASTFQILLSPERR